MVNLGSIAQALLVAEHLSFRRAAQVLGVRQSAVSRRVRALEDILGVSLFERDSTGARLTDAGRRFLDRSRPVLGEIDQAVKSAARAGRGSEGVLRIGILSSVSFGFVCDLVGHYRCHHPAIAIDIVEGSASEQIARITERQIDIAFITGTPPASHCDTAVLNAHRNKTPADAQNKSCHRTIHTHMISLRPRRQLSPCRATKIALTLYGDLVSLGYDGSYDRVAASPGPGRRRANRFSGPPAGASSYLWPLRPAKRSSSTGHRAETR